MKRSIIINMNTKEKKTSVKISFPPSLIHDSPVLFLNKTPQVHPQRWKIRENLKCHVDTSHGTC